MHKQRDWMTRLGDLLAEYRGPLSQATVAELASDLAERKITQGLVSELERGNRWGQNLDLIGVFAQALAIPIEEIHKIANLPVPPDDGEPRPRTFPEVVAQDPTLSKAAKEHLLNQYELLQMATMHERAGKQVLHDRPEHDRHHEKGA